MAYDFGVGKQICIFASELASAINENPYKPKEQTAFSVWKRFDRPTFAFSLSLAYADEVYLLCKKYIQDKPMKFPLPDEIESDLGKQQFTSSLKEIFSNREWRILRQKVMDFVDTKGFREAQEKMLLSLLGESERVNQAISTLCKEEEMSVQEKVKEVCAEISKETGKVVDKKTEEAISSKLRRDRGTVLEAKTVTDFAITSGKAVRREPAKLYRKLMTYHGVSWVLCGRVDARDESTIVEVKNRTKKFMCPDYDVLQLQAYMFLCGKSKGILLERLHGKNQETPFEFNESYWNDVVIPAMYEFVRDVEDRVIMSRSILDGVTPPLSPRKRTHVSEVESPVAFKVRGSPRILQGSSSDKDVRQGLSLDKEVSQGLSLNNEAHEGSSLDNEHHQGLSMDSKVQLGSPPRVLYGSSWDNEPSSDLENSQDPNDSFCLYLSPSETESDEELAKLPLDEIINCS